MLLNLQILTLTKFSFSFHLNQRFFLSKLLPILGSIVLLASLSTKVNRPPVKSSPYVLKYKSDV